MEDRKNSKDRLIIKTYRQAWRFFLRPGRLGGSGFAWQPGPTRTKKAKGKEWPGEGQSVEFHGKLTTPEIYPSDSGILELFVDAIVGRATGRRHDPTRATTGQYIRGCHGRARLDGRQTYADERRNPGTWREIRASYRPGIQAVGLSSVRLGRVMDGELIEKRP